jgi:hypothetical protein
LSSFEISFLIHDHKQKIRLVLSPNHDIFGENAAIQYMEPDGTLHSIEPINRLDHKVFKGSAFVRHEGHSEWINAGWARISVHRDGVHPVFEGAFRVNGDHHHIQTTHNFLQTSVNGDPDVGGPSHEKMIVWRDSDIMGTSDMYGHDELKRDIAERASCSSDVLEFNQDSEHPIYRGLDVRDAAESSLWSTSPRFLFGRDTDGTTGGNGAGVNLANSIGSTAGCPTTRRVALIGIATDCNYTSVFNHNQTALRVNVIQQVNIASQVYESTFNISLAIQNLTISNESCPAVAAPQAPWNIGCNAPGININDRLNLFSKWRGQFNDTNAYWTLLSTCNTGPAVGLAWLGQVCVQGSQTPTSGNQSETIAAANVVVRTSPEWQVFAHETGHTFGAVHDCIDTTCSDGTATKQQCCPLSKTTCNAGGQFIMNPSTGNGITKFSPCSIGNICSAIGRNSVKIGCLTNNRDVATITGSQCGNGIVESGEECDCGGPSGCGNNPCCDPNTCKLTANSVCDPTNEDCCTAQCTIAGAGTVCRPSTGTCDPQETCSGKSALCPADVTSPDGQACGDSGAGLSCASGQCTSRDLQCKTLMGVRTGTGNDTFSCGDNGCQLACSSPEWGETCLTMAQNFLDGTNCQGGGRCSNGICQGASLTNEILEFLTKNKQIIIPVSIAVGGLIIVAIIWCCVSSWRRRRRVPPPPPPRRRHKPRRAGLDPGAMYAVPQASRSQGSSSRSGGGRTRSRSRSHHPRGPPPPHMQQMPMPMPPGPDMWAPPPRAYTSARYA